MKTFNLEKFFYFDELSSEAKQQARINVMVPEETAREESFSWWRLALSMAKLNSLKQKRGLPLPKDAFTIHTLINNRLHHKRLINGSQAYYKVKAQGDKYLLSYIRDNCTIFTDKGEYVFYDWDTMSIVIVSQGDYYHLDSDEKKSLAKQSYIAINARGPAYHDSLYRMWHRVKHYMIINN